MPICVTGSIATAHTLINPDPLPLFFQSQRSIVHIQSWRRNAISICFCCHGDWLLLSPDRWEREKGKEREVVVLAQVCLKAFWCELKSGGSLSPWRSDAFGQLQVQHIRRGLEVACVTEEPQQFQSIQSQECIENCGSFNWISLIFLSRTLATVMPSTVAVITLNIFQLI